MNTKCNVLLLQRPRTGPLRPGRPPRPRRPSRLQPRPVQGQIPVRGAEQADLGQEDMEPRPEEAGGVGCGQDSLQDLPHTLMVRNYDSEIE